MRRYSIAAVLTVVVAGSVVARAADAPAEIFTRVKTEFSQGDYKRSLADVDALDAASQKPGMEADRAKLIPAIAFYRAANLAALGRGDEARDEFMTFLVYSPNTSIASPPFPKPVVEAFQKAQKGAAGRSNSMSAAYAAFVVPAGWSLPADEQWAASPVRYLLSNDEKKQYAALTAPADRQAFVENFWKALDPTPGTDVNEFRREFERRIAFADTNFGIDKTRGRETDRALIFAFLGLPTYVGNSELTADDDAIAALRSGGGNAAAPRGNSSRGFGVLTGAPNTDNLESPDRRGTRETWTYRRDRIPPGVPFQEVRFAFVTKEGYGKSVLQKDTNILQTLGLAAENARRDKKLN